MRKSPERKAFPKKGKKAGGLFSSKGSQKSLDGERREKGQLLNYAHGSQARRRDLRAK